MLSFILLYTPKVYQKIYVSIIFYFNMLIVVVEMLTSPKGLQIIRRAEKALLNERVRSINNTINMLKTQ